MIKLVGKYMLGLRNIRLYVNTESGSGNVKLLPDDKGSTTVTVGIDVPFSEATGTLLHEVYEAILIDLNTRYTKEPSFCQESSSYSFFATHNELSDAHERVGIFITEAYGDFTKAYKKFNKHN